MTGCFEQPMKSANCDLICLGEVVEGLPMLRSFSLFPWGSLFSSLALGEVHSHCTHMPLSPQFSGWPAVVVSLQSLKTLGLTVFSEEASDLLELGALPSPGHYLTEKCLGEGRKQGTNCFLKWPFKTHPYFSLLLHFLRDLEPSITQLFERFCDVNWRASQLVLVVRNPPANAGNLRVTGSIPGSRSSPGEGNGNPLQHSCLENLMDKGAWWATGAWVAKSRTWLRDWAHINMM